MDKKAILAVSFGTSYHDTLERTIGAIEQALAAVFPDRMLLRAFTSGMICRKLRERDGVDIPSPARALEQLLDEGVTDVVIQPTHVINGAEYDKLMDQAAPFREKFARLTVGAPLLTSIEDYQAVADAILEQLPGQQPDTTQVFMGHGTEHYVNPSYTLLEDLFHDMGRKDIIIGTVEGYPGLEQVLRRLSERPEVKKVRLHPLMVVAGDHARNDLAGEEPDSWKSVLQDAGYQAACDLRGLGEFPGIRRLFAQHARQAADNRD